MQAVNEKGKIYIFLQLLAEVLFVLSSRFFFPAKKKSPGASRPGESTRYPQQQPCSSNVRLRSELQAPKRFLQNKWSCCFFLSSCCYLPFGNAKKKKRERDPARQRTGSSKRGIYLLQPKWKDNSPGRQRKKAKSFKVVVFVTISWEDR